MWKKEKEINICCFVMTIWSWVWVQMLAMMDKEEEEAKNITVCACFLLWSTMVDSMYYCNHGVQHC